MKKLLALLVAVSVVCAALAGCAAAPAAEAAPAAAETEAKKEEAAPAAEEKAEEAAPAAEEAAPAGKIKIGLAAKGFSDPFTAMEANEYIRQAEEVFGDQIEMTVLDCEFDTNKQIDVLDNFIAMDVDAIICQTDDPAAILDKVAECEEKGIYFLNDLHLDDDGWSYCVESNPMDDGIALGEYTVKYIEDKGIENPVIMWMQGEVGNQHANAREKYFKETIAAAGLECTATDTANWFRDEAIALTENWLTAYPTIDVIACANDDMGLGTMYALEQAGRLDKTMVCGVDALAQAVQAVIDGKYALSIGKDIQWGCGYSIQLAIDLVNGVDRSADKVVQVPKDQITLDNPEILKKWATLHGIDYAG